MNKIIKVLFILIISIMFIPFVNAKEIPKEGVTYFLEFPDGSETIVDTYNEAMAISEKLLFDGYTDNDGNVILSGWTNTGEIRVLQFVPDGYNTNVKEIKMNLADSIHARFINYKGLANSNTGISILILFGLVVIIGTSLVISKKDKKALMIIPISLIAFTFTSVKAWNNSLVINVVDDQGNSLKNVRVQIYGKPVIETSPAIKFTSNGGYFFDGSSEMYYKIPYSGCSYSEFKKSLTEEEYSYLKDNLEYAYLDGYTRELPDTNIKLRNGTVLALKWTPSSNKKLIRVVGNKGMYLFHNKYLAEISFNNDTNQYNKIKEFKRTGYYLIGTDDNAECSNYNEYGLKENETNNNSNTLYLCWNNKPDGIYVNGFLLKGSIDSCFKESNLYISDDYIELKNGSDRVDFIITDNRQVKFYYYTENDSQQRIDADEFNDRPSDKVAIIRVVYHGEILFAVPAKDLTLKDNMYTINSASKTETLYQYLNNLNTKSCNK